MNNPNCDGSGPCSSNPEVRVLPTGGDSNAILCYACYLREMSFRLERNSSAAKPQLSESAKFKLPAWESLKVYGEPSTEEKLLQHQQHAVKLVEKAMEK